MGNILIYCFMGLRWIIGLHHSYFPSHLSWLNVSCKLNGKYLKKYVYSEELNLFLERIGIV